MADDARPVVVAYDGSAAAHEALTVSARLFGNHRLVVVTLWEPAFAAQLAAFGTGMPWVAMPPSGEGVLATERAQREHASAIADRGVEIVRKEGAVAEAAPGAAASDIAETIAAIARDNDACAVVVGSRGLGAVKAELLGSTSRGVLRASTLPVLVVTDHR